MTNTQDTSSSQPSMDSKDTNIVDKAIDSIVQFVQKYLYTLWVFFRWPFKRSSDVFNEDSSKQFLPPHSFLFICCLIFYFASEIVYILLYYNNTIDPKQILLISSFSQINLSFESFALKTAPVITIFILTAYISAWILGSRNEASKREIYSTICYLSGYVILLISFTAFIANFLLMIAIKPKALPDIFFFLTDFSIFSKADGISAFMISIVISSSYFSINVLIILYSLSKSIIQKTGLVKKDLNSFTLRFLVVIILLTASVHLCLAVNSFLISNDHKTLLNENMISAMAVVSNINDIQEKNELPLSVAVINNTDKTIILFNHIPLQTDITVHGKSSYSWRFKFTSLSSHDKFIELKPKTIVNIAGNLHIIENNETNKNEQWQTIVKTWRENHISITIYFLGSHLTNRSVELFEVNVDSEVKRYIWGGLLFSDV